ncbi:hypothetical protein B0H10DRAFT_1109116 [Mycena sp. CBHHK59/15]|nr:hypothetical protein B0H10DRAFT_1109116 [Mycena sp. CBHHK59/15]
MGPPQTQPRVFLLCYGSLHDDNFVSRQRHRLLWKHFTPATCKRFYMLPNVTAMLAGMAAQILVFIRTYAISANSTFVCYGLGSVLLLGFPVQIFGIVYHRDPLIHNGGCKGQVLRPHEPDWNIVYYSAHMTYDLIACATATFFLIYSFQFQGVFNLSNFVRRVLAQGLIYFLLVFLVNLSLGGS